MSVSISIDSRRVTDALRAHPEQVRQRLEMALSRGAMEVTREARQRAPKAFSHLSKSIGFKREAELHYVVSTKMKYAIHMEEGVKGPLPHPPGVSHGLLEWIKFKLRPKDDKELSRIAFAVGFSIQKKGIKAQPFMEPAKAAKEKRVMELAEKAVDQAVQEFGRAG